MTMTSSSNSSECPPSSLSQAGRRASLDVNRLLGAHDADGLCSIIQSEKERYLHPSLVVHSCSEIKQVKNHAPNTLSIDEDRYATKRLEVQVLSRLLISIYWPVDTSTYSPRVSIPLGLLPHLRASFSLLHSYADELTESPRFKFYKVRESENSLPP